MKQSVYKQYQKAFAEVNYILENSEDEVINRIPNKLKSIIKENLDKSYIVNIDLEKGLKNCNLLEKTKEILYLIYRDYLVTPQEREQLLKEEAEEERKIEQELREKYNPDNIFKNKEKYEKQEELNLVVKEEKVWYKKFINKIISFFKRKIKKNER